MARKQFDFQLSEKQQQMAIDNINLARREAWRVQRTTGIEYSVLEGAAFLGLCKACNRYNPESGFKFSSLATPTIRGELLHWVRDKTYPVRFSHRFRETWVKGNKLLVKGTPDIEVAKTLEISLEEWLEVKMACSGPPLELKEHAMPTDPLEPDEIDFKVDYRSKAAIFIQEMTKREQNAVTSFMRGDTSKPPLKLFKSFMYRLEEKGLT